MSLKNTILRFFCHISNKFWWVHWSNFRFRKEERFNTEVDNRYKVETIDDVCRLVEKLYEKFEYTADGPDQLWDAVLPPPYAYKQFTTNEKYKEDCDGFHSLLMQCLRASGVPCYLTIVWAWRCGHCVLVCKMHDKWYMIDYTRVYQGEETLQEAIDAYNKIFVKKYSGCKTEVLYNGFLGYDYKKGKFRMVNPEKELAKTEKGDGQQ